MQLGISGEAAIDRRRVDQQVGAVGARGVAIVWTPPMKYVGVGQVGVAPHAAGPFRSLANEVSHVDLGSVVHQRRCAVDDDAAVTAERTERPVAGRRRIQVSMP